MFQRLRNALSPSSGSLATAFWRLGWAGFWLQVVFGSLPILVMAYYFVFSRSDTFSRSGLPFIEYLTIVNLLLLGFTTFWSYRYTRLASRLRDPELRPPEASVVSMVWTGIMASTVSMLFSLVVMLIEAGNLLFYFLKAPQGGIPVVQTGSGYFVSSVDMVSLMALNLALFAELIVQIFSLWLLARMGYSSLEYPRTAEAPAPAGVAPSPAELLR